MSKKTILESFVEAGICLTYSPNTSVRQIPRVEDVVVTLQLSGQNGRLSNDTARGNYQTNMLLVAATVCNKILEEGGADDRDNRKIIAEAIIVLCPQEAKCLLNDGFVEAQEILTGMPAPSRTADPKVVREICGCSRCKRG